MNRSEVKGFFALMASKTLLATSAFLMKVCGASMWLISGAIAIIGAMVVKALFWEDKPDVLTKPQLAIEYLRLILRDVGFFMMWWAYLHASVPRLSAIFFSALFVVPVCDRIFFQQKQAWWRWVLLGCGCVGVALIVAPWDEKCSGDLFWDLVAVVASLVVTSNHCLLKYLTQKNMRFDSSIKRSAYLRFVLFVVLTAIFCRDWDVAFSLKGHYGPAMMIFWIVLTSLAQNFGAILHVLGVGNCGLGYIMFLDLWRFAYSCLFGYLVFNQVLKGRALLGSAIIIVVVTIMAYSASTNKNQDVPDDQL